MKEMYEQSALNTLPDMPLKTSGQEGPPVQESGSATGSNTPVAIDESGKTDQSSTTSETDGSDIEVTPASPDEDSQESEQSGLEAFN